MPYKDKYKDRLWHKQYMRDKRRLVKLNSRVVTPSTLNLLHPVIPTTTPTATPNIDADGNVIYDV